MNISYEGIDSMVVTFPIGTCQVGQVCKVGITGGADMCDSGDKFCGVMLSAKTGMAAVQVEGFVRVGYSGSKLAHGYVALAADGNGKVVANSNGREYLVAEVDTQTMTAIIKL